MTRDKLNDLIEESGVSMFFRQDLDVFPLGLRFFCREMDRFLVEEFIWKFMPVTIWVIIVTECYDYRGFTLPRATFKQHWNDCFGWAICLR